MTETSINTMNNISEKTKLLFVDGIPENIIKNGKKVNIISEISKNNKGVIFFTDNTNLPVDNLTEEQKRLLGYDNYPQTFYNIYKDGKRYTKFQDVIKNSYVSIGSHKIYLKNDNGFLSLVQAKDIQNVEISKISQISANNPNIQNDQSITTTYDENNIVEGYTPESIEINSIDNKFNIEYIVNFITNIDSGVDESDNSGDISLRFEFYTKNILAINDYSFDPTYIEYLPENSYPSIDVNKGIYEFRCLKPSNNNIYIKAISNYDAEKFIYYPVTININVTDIVFRDVDTDRVIRNDIKLKLNESKNISYSYEPENANKIELSIQQTPEYYDLDDHSTNSDIKYFTITGKALTKNLPDGHTTLSIKVGCKRKEFNVYITKDKEYYWYVGTVNPLDENNNIISSIIGSDAPIETDITSCGLHKINENITYSRNIPLVDAEYKHIEFDTNEESSEEYIYYIAIPTNLPNNNETNNNVLKPRHEIYDANSGDNENVYEIIADNCEIDEVNYKIYKSLVPAKQFAGKIF